MLVWRSCCRPLIQVGLGPEWWQMNTIRLLQKDGFGISGEGASYASCIVWKREYQNVKRNRFTRAKVNTKQLTWIYEILWEYSTTGAPGWLCCRLDRCCRKRRPHSGEESVLGRGRQSFTICNFFRELLKWTFWNTKQTIRTIRTHCLWKNIIESVHQYIICRSRGSPQWCCPSHGCTIGFKECRPSIGCRRGRTRLCHFSFRSVLFHVQYLSRPDGFRWIEYIKVPEGYTHFGIPVNMLSIHFSSSFGNHCLFLAIAKVIRFRTCQVPI